MTIGEIFSSLTDSISHADRLFIGSTLVIVTPISDSAPLSAHCNFLNPMVFLTPMPSHICTEKSELELTCFLGNFNLEFNLQTLAHEDARINHSMLQIDPKNMKCTSIKIEKKTKLLYMPIPPIQRINRWNG